MILLKIKTCCKNTGKAIFALLVFFVSFFQLHAQPYFSKIINFNPLTYEQFNDLKVYEGRIFGTSISYCLDGTSCDVLMELNEEGEILWINESIVDATFTSCFNIINDTIYVAGINRNTVDELYEIALTLEGEELYRDTISQPDSLYRLAAALPIIHNGQHLFIGQAKKTLDNMHVGFLAYRDKDSGKEIFKVYEGGDIWNAISDASMDDENQLSILLDYRYTDIIDDDFYMGKTIWRLDDNYNKEWEWDVKSPTNSSLIADRYISKGNGDYFFNMWPEYYWSGCEEVWYVDSTAELQWTFRETPCQGINKHVVGYSLAENGDILMCGYADLRDIGVDIEDYEDYLNYRYSGYLGRISPEGEWRWSRAYVFPDSLTGEMFSDISEIIELENGDLVLGGDVRRTTLDADGELLYEVHNWLLRTNSEGCLTPDCGPVVGDITTKVIDLLALEVDLKVFPNPSSDIININLEETVQVENVKFYNAMGHLMQEQKDLTPISVADYVAGLYVLVVETKDGGRRSEKVIVE